MDQGLVRASAGLDQGLVRASTSNLAKRLCHRLDQFSVWTIEGYTYGACAELQMPIPVLLSCGASQLEQPPSIPC